MHWIDKIYKTLDRKYQDELAPHNLTSEQIIKALFYTLRKFFANRERVYIKDLGTFRVKSERLYSLSKRAHKQLLKAIEQNNEHNIEKLTSALTELVEAYNKTIDKERPKPFPTYYLEFKNNQLTECLRKTTSTGSSPPTPTSTTY